MRISMILSAFFIFLAGCAENEIDLPLHRMKGTVKGVEWEYKFANGYLHSSDLKYRMLFLSKSDRGSDACAVPSTSSPHLSMVIDPKIGSYSLPLPVHAETVRFHLTPGNSQIATEGFLEIFNVIDGKVLGYIQARLDEDNTVEGRFEVRLCN